jgi:hypothetical protein
MPRLPFPFIMLLDVTGPGERCAAGLGALALPSMKEDIQRYEGPREVVAYATKNIAEF